MIIFKAVILPTIWLYLNKVFHAPPYFLGIVLSSFSVADLLSGLLLGRLSDKTGQTKLLLVLTNVLQAVGSFLYIIDVGPEFLVVSRLVTGLGSGISAPLIGDLARVIPDSERTSTLSIFFALRQAGLVLGPACNIFLSKFDFYFASYHVNKFTSPGFFMTVLWVIHELMSIFMFWNLPSLQLQQQLTSRTTLHPSFHQDTSTLPSHEVIAHDDNDTRQTTSRDDNDTRQTTSHDNNDTRQTTSRDDNDTRQTTSRDDNDTRQTTSRGNEAKVATVERSSKHNLKENDKIHEFTQDADLKKFNDSTSDLRKFIPDDIDNLRDAGIPVLHGNAIQHLKQQLDSCMCGSNDYMETAEVLIRLKTALRCHQDLDCSFPSNLKSSEEIERSRSSLNDDISPKSQGVISDKISKQMSDLFDVNPTSNKQNVDNPPPTSFESNFDQSIVNCTRINDEEFHDDPQRNRTIPSPHEIVSVGDQSTTDVGCGDDNDHHPKIFHVSRELFKPYLIALLMTVFVGFFNQLALEALLTPLTQRYLSWNEMENSYMYCAAGIQVIVMFLLIRPISRRVEDKWLIMIGLILQLISIGVLMSYVPWVKEESIIRNLIVFSVAIFINLCGLPMLMVCSNSLFTRLIPSQIQGFSQGIRKIFGGVGTILGPLWASGAIDNLMLLLGVMVLTSCIALILLIASFRDLTPLSVEPHPPATQKSPRSGGSRVSDETTPLLRV